MQTAVAAQSVVTRRVPMAAHARPEGDKFRADPPWQLTLRKVLRRDLTREGEASPRERGDGKDSLAARSGLLSNRCRELDASYVARPSGGRSRRVHGTCGSTATLVDPARCRQALPAAQRSVQPAAGRVAKGLVGPIPDDFAATDGELDAAGHGPSFVR